MTFDKLRKRHGTFSIERDLFEKEPEMVRRLLSKVLIYKATFVDYDLSIRYHGFSKLFDEVLDGQNAAIYMLRVNRKIFPKNCVYKGKKIEKGDSVIVGIEFESTR
jgi:hypothetical protein